MVSRTAAVTCSILARSSLQSIPSLLAEMRPLVTPRHLVISIAAGVTLSQLADGLGPERRLIRVMPNTPCLVGLLCRRRLCRLGHGHGRRLSFGRSPHGQRWQSLLSFGKTARRGHRTERQRPGLRVRHDRSPQRRRRAHGLAARRRHPVGRPDGFRRRQDAPGNRAARGRQKDQVRNPEAPPSRACMPWKKPASVPR